MNNLSARILLAFFKCQPTDKSVVRELNSLESLCSNRGIFHPQQVEKKHTIFDSYCFGTFHAGLKVRDSVSVVIRPAKGVLVAGNMLNNKNRRPRPEDVYFQRVLR